MLIVMAKTNPSTGDHTRVTVDDEGATSCEALGIASVPQTMGLP